MSIKKRIEMSILLALWPVVAAICPASHQGDGICDAPCMTPISSFDIGSSPFSDCSASCTAHCNSSLLNNSVCDQQCQTWDCQWDHGDCSECAGSCGIEMLGNGNCELECNVGECGWDFGDCNSEFVPQEVYVGGNEKGDGSLRYPFDSLADTLESLFLPYNYVHLLPGQHDLVSHGQPFLTQWSLIATSIEGPECSSTCPAVIRLTRTFPTFQLTHNVTFRNIHFNSAFELRENCRAETCLYCPFLQQIDSGEWVNDREQIVDSALYANQTYCDLYHSVVFINTTASLWLQNVTFSGFRQQLKAIIVTQCGDLKLENVSFTHCLASFNGGSGGLIQHFCPYPNQPYACGRIIYTGGTISYLNDGYEYRPDLLQSGFLLSEGIWLLVLSDLQFLYNTVLIGQETGQDAALLKITNFRQIQVSNCLFSSLIVDSAALMVDSSFLFPLVVVNGIASEQLLTHLSIRYCVFINVTVLNGSLVALTYAKDHQNIDLLDITVKNAVVAQSLLRIYNKESREEDWKGAARTLKAAEVFFPARFVTIKRLIMTGNICANAVFLANIGNFMLISSNFEGNGEAKSGDSPYNTAFNSFVTANSGHYLSKTPILPISVICQSSITLLTVLNLTFLSNNIADNYCPSGISGLNVAGKAGFIDISSNSFLGNVGSGAITLQLEQKLVLSNLICSGNRNAISHFSVCLDLRMTSPTDVTITDSHFEGNFGWLSVVLFADNVKSLVLERVTLLSNTAKYRCAGVLFNPYGTGESELLVRDSLFIGNTAAEYGVLSVMDYYGILDGNTLEQVKITVSNCTFRDNGTRGIGAAVTLAEDIDLEVDSRISNSVFISNQAELGAGVSALFETGLLTITNCIFLGNSAPIGAAMYLHPSAPLSNTISGVHYRNCVFKGQRAGPAIYMQGLAANINVSSLNNTVEDGVGAIHIAVADFLDQNSQYKGQIASEGPGLFAQDHSNVVLIGVIVNGNYATGSGGAIFLTSSTNLTVNNCEFIGNTAASRGGVIYMDQNSQVIIVNATFRFNKATVASAIYASPALLFINSSLISDNFVSEFGSICLSQCTAHIAFTTLRNNTSNGSDPGLILSNCDVYINSSIFTDQTGENGVFLQGLDSNYVEIRASQFLRGHATQTGGAISSSSHTNIDIYDSSFADCSSAQEAGAIALHTGHLSLSNCSFTGITAQTVGGVLVIREGTLEMQNCRVENAYPEAFYLFGGDLVLIFNSAFLNSSSGTGGSVEFHDIVTSLLEKNQFIGCNGATGGAVYYQSGFKKPPLDQHSLVSNLFTDNKAAAGIGGAVFAQDVDLVVSNNTFRENTADKGGAIATSCAHQSWCNITIIGNLFQQNKAEKEGGAVTWSGAFPTFSSNIYEENQAKYAPNIASFPVKIAPIAASGAALEPSVTLRLTNIASGHLNTETLQFGLFDHLDALVTVDSESSAQLLPVNQSLLSVFGATMAVAKEGLFAFARFGFTGQPGSIQYLTVVTDGVDLKLQAKDRVEYWEKVLIEVQFRECVSGESDADGVCIVCSAGTYSLDPTLPCLLCPNEAICYGNNTMVPKPGYWRQSNDTDVFISCLAAEACTGSPEPPMLSLTGLCAQGYTGNLCQQCQQEYSSTGRHQCSKCPQLVSNIVLTVIISLLALALVALIVWTAIKSAMRPQSLIAIYAKIFMNYLQMVVVSAALNLNWPTFVKTFLNSQQLAGGVAEQLFSFDCLLQGHSTGSLYFAKVQMYAGLPLGLFLLSVVAWLTVAALTKVENLLKKLVATAVILIFILHPSLTKVMFSLFSCMSLGDSRTYLVNDLSIVCWDSEHMKQILTVVIPSIVIVLFGLPLFTLLILVIRRSKLDSNSMKITLCFLYKGYTRSHYYWEFFILYRKVAMITASVFLAQVSIRMQALTVLAILLFALFCQLQVRPFFDPMLNRLEVKAILVSALTIYSGLYYDTNKLNVWLKIGIFGVMILANAYFLMSWLRLVSPVLLKTIKERLSKLLQWRKSHRIRALERQTHMPNPSEKPNFQPDFSSELSVSQHISFESAIPTPYNPPNTSLVFARENSEEQAKEQAEYALAD